ncbi:hypothetical protein B7P43_G11616 [Cryptotermes secundus]|uniref:HD/PDEase domain-containing protein n=2 Tax=Cryptotermes secundus TaxID=105785 RepID=A0A2J7RBQ1_9NEOP|nr:deoxynucleoside triphosphate triphosphohydrolase SAMHD1 isoform X2 [Cryptotermes secundus]XP_023703067.1 deoxynucleoside triphosphate triphosphohydrolase SAMHD1 isoform X2 [Cryptotermes secundus]XP_023703068.1 deoxynucleoside triphosphate triphosphohydrolase SAMHD1 isoform X2 [Cryptotermes secundus]XP_023703069.1 deoxynucleoside triphosphate triphosphohydrolase SAMHD1 isoform X2 [Cryptotermes secundus]XP_033606460.1 deoxynucleoside triphosphate triphosphohydrolase SAMHD1 isoform X2 [Cryptote
MSTGYKVFNDCVHGHINLHPLCVRIVDTPQFQRLRNVKQVGPVYFVYPGASHNRFEHSLGVCHLAGKMVDALRKSCNDQSIVTDDEKLCLEIAGLCHDLGHGPFSHTWEKFIDVARNKEGMSETSGAVVSWKHEEGSVQMFEYLLEQNKLRDALVEAVPELKDKAVEFIKELIRGKGTLKSDKKFLYQIISNKDNGIDVDRFEYFLRDGRQLNISSSFDYNRLLEFCYVIEVHGEKCICFRNKERHSLYEMFQVRVNLYHKAYCHHVAQCIEQMVIDAFVEADRKGYKIRVSNDKVYQLSEAHCHSEALSRMTDHIFYDILYSTEEDYEQARELLHRILKRDLYKVVAYKNFSTKLLKEKEKAIETCSSVAEIDKEVKERIKECKLGVEKDIKQICERMTYCKFEQFKVVMTKLDMGVEMEDAVRGTAEKKNPFNNIYFYDKNKLSEAREIEWSDVPVFPVPEGSIFHVHGTVIYKDVDNPVSKNETLKDELETFKAELMKLWK